MAVPRRGPQVLDFQKESKSFERKERERERGGGREADNCLSLLVLSLALSKNLSLSVKDFYTRLFGFWNVNSL